MSAPTLAGLPVGWAALIALINVVISGSAVAWIRSRGAWLKNEADADAKLRNEMWRDIAQLKISNEDKGKRLTAAEQKIATQTVQIGQQRFILALLTDELERVSPGNSYARQARVLLDVIQPDAMPANDEITPITDLIAKMSIMKDTPQ